MKKFKRPWLKMNKTTSSCSLYIHIPFCAHICKYCDFTKLFYNEKFAKDYLKALFKEIDSYHINKVDTIYIGGGTPTSLSDDDFESLLKKVKLFLHDGGEFTVEANVENLSCAKLDLMQKYGVTRLSIGIQSTSNERLKEIGRSHTYEDAVNVVNEAKKRHFDSINVDLIYGFKEQNLEDLKNDLEKILKLETEHISIYSLIVAPGTVFYNNNYQEQNEDESRQFYDLILETLRENGYERYEISNFAKNKKYSRHNLTYWKDKEYYGVGLGASGYLGNVRYENTKNLDKYLKGEFVASKEEIDKDKDITYFLITNLRLEQGFLRKDFENRFGFDFVESYSQKIEKFVLTKDIIIEDERVRLSDEGLLIMDYILREII